MTPVEVYYDVFEAEMVREKPRILAMIRYHILVS